MSHVWLQKRTNFSPKGTHPIHKTGYPLERIQIDILGPLPETKRGNKVDAAVVDVYTSRGCPQGSNLGPLLWNIFQNDLVQIIHEGRLTMYAEDHQVYSAGEKIDDVETILNDEGTRTSEWYHQNLLKCNQDKFQAMRLGPRHKKKEMNLNIKDINIKSSSGIDLLGVAIDDEVSFTKHINNACTKGARKVGVLMRFRNLIPTEAKLRIFEAFILPQVTYYHIVWHHCRSSDERKLQERALRATYCDRTGTSRESKVSNVM